MIDPVTAALDAVTTRSPGAVAGLFLAGVMTSVGPCIAPRYVAIAALAHGDRRPAAATLSFVAGLIAAFVSLGFIAGSLGALWSFSGALYGLLGLGLIGAGCVSLVRAVPTGRGLCAAHAAGDHQLPSGGRRSTAAVFLLGATSALVVSPCCTPVVAVIVATSTAIGKPLTGALLLLSFAVGHALPLLCAGRFATFVVRLVPRGIGTQAAAIVCAVLMLALGIYYSVLA